MARGDLTIFNVARLKMLTGDWASTDHFYVAICDNTTTPAADTATPVIGDFTEVGDSGTYTAGGTDLGTWTSLVTIDGATVTIDSDTNPTWAADASNDTDAYWGIIYNYTDAGKDALAFLDLGGPVDMSSVALTITWPVAGFITLA